MTIGGLRHRDLESGAYKHLAEALQRVSYTQPPAGGHFTDPNVGHTFPPTSSAIQESRRSAEMCRKENVGAEGVKARCSGPSLAATPQRHVLGLKSKRQRESRSSIGRTAPGSSLGVAYSGPHFKTLFSRPHIHDVVFRAAYFKIPPFLHFQIQEKSPTESIWPFRSAPCRMSSPASCQSWITNWGTCMVSFSRPFQGSQRSGLPGLRLTVGSSAM